METQANYSQLGAVHLPDSSSTPSLPGMTPRGLFFVTPPLISCHTRFSKEQNQANHMCAQKVHTYVRMKKY
jgi:hypothetical protein